MSGAARGDGPAGESLVPDRAGKLKLDRSVSRTDDGSDFADGISEEIVESFLGEEEIPDPRRRGGWGFLVSWFRIVLRLIFPRANQTVFAAGFWLLRLVGLLIVASWLYFGLSAEEHFDRVKLWSGIAIFLVGPLLLRAVEFVLENLALRGVTANRWRDFWSFRRMMTPRSIQTVFFVGFWVLVGAGVLQIGHGLHGMIVQPRLREDDLAELLAVEQWREPSRLIERLRDSDDPKTRRLLEILSGERADPAADSSAEGKAASEPQAQRLTQEIYGALVGLLLEPRVDGDGSPGRVSGKAGAPSPFERIVRGLLLLVLGPLALRFTCESIILFFRMNETLTDISRHLERLNRRMDGQADPEDRLSGN